MEKLLAIKALSDAYSSGSQRFSFESEADFWKLYEGVSEQHQVTLCTSYEALKEPSIMDLESLANKVLIEPSEDVFDYEELESNDSKWAGRFRFALEKATEDHLRFNPSTGLWVNELPAALQIDCLRDEIMELLEGEDPYCEMYWNNFFAKPFTSKGFYEATKEFVTTEFGYSGSWWAFIADSYFQEVIFSGLPVEDFL